MGIRPRRFRPGQRLLLRQRLWELMAMRWLSRSRTTRVTDVVQVPTRKSRVAATPTLDSWSAPVSGDGGRVSDQASTATPWLIAALALTTWAPGLFFAQSWSYDHQEWAQDHPAVLLVLPVPFGVGAVLCARLALRCSPPAPSRRRTAGTAVLAVVLSLWLLVGFLMLVNYGYRTSSGGG
jgi:hypothetical protein